MDILEGFRGAIAGFREGAFNGGIFAPSVVIGRNEERWDLYRRNWEFYRNTAFEDVRLWSRYMEMRGLYEETRLIYNPLKSLVEFYVGRIYPGRVTANGKELPFAVRDAIPFSGEMGDGLRKAAAQVMEWSRWQTAKSGWIRLTAVMGNSLLEVVDDVEAGKTRLKVWESTKVKDFELNDAGNLEWYWLEFPVWEAEGERQYTYGRKVTREEVIIYEDGEEKSRRRLGYGFVPAVIARHKDVGDMFGADVFDGDYIKLEELNSIATHGLDNLHKNIDPAVVLWTDTRITDALKKSNEAESGGGETDDGWTYKASNAFKILKGGQGGKIEPLVGRLASDEVLKQLESLIGQIEKDHPELVYYDKLREMQYVSGPGARALIGDTESNYLEACANYDEALERALEMAIAIGGQRLKQGTGAWSEKSEKQAKFGEWDLDSYRRDKLNVEIMTRPLLPWTIDDETAVKKGRAEVAVVAGDFVSVREQMKIFGIEERSEQDRIMREMAGEDMNMVEAEAEASAAGEIKKMESAPQSTDPNLTANSTVTGKTPQRSRTE